MESVVSRRVPPSGAGEADAVQAESLKGGVPAGGDEQLVRRDRGAMGRAVSGPGARAVLGAARGAALGAAVEHDGKGAVVVLMHAPRTGVQAEVDAIGAQAGSDQVCGLLRENAQEPAAGHERHGRTKPGIGLGEFDAGNAAAEDRKPRGNRAG